MVASKKKALKVKDLADKYKISVKEVVSELATEGIELEGNGSTIPADFEELVLDYFDQKYGAKRSLKKIARKDDEDEAETVPSDESAKEEEIHLKSPIVVRILAEAIGKKPNEVIQTLIKFNVLAGINQTIDIQTALKVGKHYSVNLQIDKRSKDSIPDIMAPIPTDIEKPEDLVHRPPVVTFLGHVDHGKTSLQDRARRTNIVSGESGGITQHIGASTIVFNNYDITFIDTPGHAAFTAMRARGANATDIAILVVAADDGFKPQTIEALSHAKAAKVPIIVAANKIDLPQADLEKVLREMQIHGIPSEDWGGEHACIPVSALTGQGMDLLLERILLEAEMLSLKANPKKLAKGVVLESQLEQGFGPTASVLIQSGTLKIGDAILCGPFSGKVRSLIDDKGVRVKTAGPSKPVKVIGLDGVPEAGEKLIVYKTEKEAKELASNVAQTLREKSLGHARGTSLEDLFTQLDSEKKNTLRVILKTDVKGSSEAIADSLLKLPSEKISVDIIHSGVGAITENDTLLAAASNAIVIGFHVRVNTGVNTLAKQKGVEVRLYSIIYQLIEDIMEAMVGKLAPEKREIQQGTGHILKIFEVHKGPPICGSMIDTGFVRVGSKVRVFRAEELIFNGEVKSLRRYQDDVKEVRQGVDCGIRLDNFKDLEENDILHFYELKSEKASLS